MKAPTEFKDMMGYCRPCWISDYSYRAIFKRLQIANSDAEKSVVNEPRRFRVGLVDGSGTFAWRRYDNIRSRVDGDQIDIELLNKAGKTTGHVTGHYFLYDHEPGGMLLVPAPADATAPAAIRPAGMERIVW